MALSANTPEDTQQGTFAIWKPRGISSFQALRAIKRAHPGEKVGHAGTLDPLAEGVLVVAVGRAATRLLSESVAKDKEYVATITLGTTSRTDDAEGPLTPHHVDHQPTRVEVAAAAAQFVGTSKQLPPPYSAIKVAGRPAYARARGGETLALQPRTIRIDAIDLIDYAWPIVTLRCVTGPGVYIRSLARDLGEALGTGAYLSGLVRTRVGTYTRAEARVYKIGEPGTN